MNKKFPIEPFHEYVIVKPFPPDAVSDGGIIIPDSFKERMNKATVTAVGEGLKEKSIKVDDAVIHVKGAGTLIEHNKEEYYIMRFTDILCRVEN